MKKTILSSIMVLCAVSMSAQASEEYVPLVREGMKWECELYHTTPDYENSTPNDIEYHFPYTIEFRGDTTINGKTYKKCYYFFEGQTSAECDSTLRAFVREDVEARQVWALGNPNYKSNSTIGEYIGSAILWHKEQTEILIYDFSNVVSPEIYYMQSFGAEPEVNNDIETIDGKECRSYEIIGTHDTLCLVEGVGYSGFTNYYGGDLLTPCGIDATANLRSFYTIFYRLRNADGVVVYRTTADIGEGPGAGIITPIDNETIASVDVYSVQGVLLKQEASPETVTCLAPGLYIVKHCNVLGECVKTTKVAVR